MAEGSLRLGSLGLGPIDPADREKVPSWRLPPSSVMSTSFTQCQFLSSPLVLGQSRSIAQGLVWVSIFPRNMESLVWEQVNEAIRHRGPQKTKVGVATSGHGPEVGRLCATADSGP